MQEAAAGEGGVDGLYASAAAAAALRVSSAANCQEFSSNSVTIYKRPTNCLEMLKNYRS